MDCTGNQAAVVFEGLQNMESGRKSYHPKELLLTRRRAASSR